LLGNCVASAVVARWEGLLADNPENISDKTLALTTGLPA